MPKFLEDYTTVDELINKMNTEYPECRLIAEMIGYGDDWVIFKSSFYETKEDTEPKAVAYAKQTSKDHNSWFERNDLFFFFYAFLSFSFVVLWGEGFWLGLPIAIGIGLYGLAYFIVHDVFIHQRFKMFRNIDNKYARGVRRAHKIHHKNINKEGGECFGMLIVPFKYFK